MAAGGHWLTRAAITHLVRGHYRQSHWPPLATTGRPILCGERRVSARHRWLHSPNGCAEAGDAGGCCGRRPEVRAWLSVIERTRDHLPCLRRRRGSVSSSGTTDPPLAAVSLSPSNSFNFLQLLASYNH